MSGLSVLGDLKVLELSSARVAYAGRLLSDLGADVVKIEPPEGDPLRHQEPFLGDRPGPDNSLPFLYYNAGKRSITLDLRSPEGQTQFRQLATTADILLDGSPPGYLEGMGLGYDQLSEAAPGLICVAVTGFGRDGPYAHFVDTDNVCFAMSGLMYISGDPRLPPVVGPGQQAYDITGMYAAWSALLAVWERIGSGRGQLVDVAARDCLAAEEHTISTFSDEGVSLTRVGSQHQVAVPGSIFPARDGFVNAFVSDTMPGSWQRLLEWMNHPTEWTSDPRLEDGLYRRANVEQLNPTFRRFTAERPKAEMMREGQSRHLSVVPVYEPGEFLDDEHCRARGFLGTVKHPAHGTIPMPGSPFVIDGERQYARAPAPLLGQHTRQVLSDWLGSEEGSVVEPATHTAATGPDTK